MTRYSPFAWDKVLLKSSFVFSNKGMSYMHEMGLLRSLSSDVPLLAFKTNFQLNARPFCSEWNGPSNSKNFCSIIEFPFNHKMISICSVVDHYFLKVAAKYCPCGLLWIFYASSVLENSFDTPFPFRKFPTRLHLGVDSRLHSNICNGSSVSMELLPQ